MRAHLIRGVLALTIVFVVSASAAAQSIVRGRVVDGDGNPIEGAMVTIEAVEADRRSSTTTDSSGTFLQIGLPFGAYNVTVVWEDMKQTLPASVSRSTPVNLSFELTPVSGFTPEELKANLEIQQIANEALAAMNGGRNEEAIQKFNELITRVPDCDNCFQSIGIAYTNLGQLDQAEAAFKRVIEMNPDSPNAYTGLANIYNSTERFDLAQQASAKAAELSAAATGGGGSAETLFNQGVVMWNAGNFAEAKEQFEAAVKADPGMALAHYQLGMALLNLGEIPAARAAFEEYLKVDPNGEKAGEVKVFIEQLPR